MSLIRAEFGRFFARRFIVIMIGFILILLATIALGFAANTQRITEADWAAARAQSEQYRSEQERYLRQEYDRCVAAQEPGLNCQDFLDKATSGTYAPDPAYLLPPHFDFVDEIETTLYIAAAILGLFGFVVGASFVGAEWTSGGLTNLLLWRTRRIPVLGTKLGTALLAVFGIGAGYLLIWIATMWGIGEFGGVSDGTTAGFWQSTVLTALRALTVGVGATAIGFSLASLGRRTAAALGVGIGYALVAELGTLIVFQVINTSFPQRYRLSTYLGAWMEKRIVLYDYDFCRFTIGDCQPREYVIDLQWSSWVLGSLVVLLVAGALLSFQRRDVA